MKTLKWDNDNPISKIKDVYLIEEKVHLLAPEEKMLERFSAIEDPKFILATGKNNSPTSLNYFRYELATTGAPLIYELSEKGASTKVFPGYELQRYGVHPGKNDPAYGVLPLPLIFDGFQLLKKDGDEKVLIPLRQFEQEFNHSGEPLSLLKPVFPQNYAKCSLYDYTVNQETNRLVAKTGDAYAYLAYLCLAHSDYDSASYYLNKARTSSGYGENYDQVFLWMNDLKDDTPNGVALQLHFELFHERVLEDRRMHNIREGKLAQVEENDIKRISRLVHLADIYEKYTNSMKTANKGEVGPDPSLNLSGDEEQYIVQLIKELLKEHGNQSIHTEESRQIRAEEVPLQNYLSGVNGKEFIRNKSVGIFNMAL